VLTLLTVGLTLGPLVYQIIVYRDDLGELLIPAEFSGLVNGDYSNSSVSGVINDLSNPVELPEYVSSNYDPVSGEVRFLFNFTNPFGFDLNLRSMYANVSCFEHGFVLGKASLVESVQLGSGENVLLPLKLSFTDQALAHFAEQHSGDGTVSVDLWGINVSISGISIDLPQKFTVIDVPLR
jgi:hypothetical protein